MNLPQRLRDRADSYRQSGPSAEHTAVLLDEAADALEAARAEVDRQRRILSEVDRLSLVIDSAVRWSDPPNRPQVLAMISAARAALEGRAPDA